MICSVHLSVVIRWYDSKHHLTGNFVLNVSACKTRAAFKSVDTIGSLSIDKCTDGINECLWQLQTCFRGVGVGC